MSKSPQHLTYANPNGAGTVPGAGHNSVGRVFAFGDVLELTPELLERVGPDWVAQRLEGGKWVPGSLDDNPDIRERREQIDAAERARFAHYVKTGL